MSQNRRNNHYHYAEQYTDGSYRRRVRAASVLRMPKRAVFFAVLMLLVLGIVTATFSANNTSADDQPSGSLIVKVRNTKTANDLVVDGMDREEALALTGANYDLAATAAVTDLRYNSSTKGWGTDSTVKGNSSGWIPVSFSDASNESFKIYHDGWGDAYFSKSAAAVSLNTQYTLNNTGSNPNMTYSFAAGNYGIKIENPDAYNNMKMTIYRLFDASSVFYIDVSDFWSADNPEIGGYFCDSTSNTATWVRAERCGDISNTHLYRLVAPSSAIYSKLVLGRFQTGTTAAQMQFSGTRFWNQSVDILYQAGNTKIKITSAGKNGSEESSTVSTSSITHTHKYYAYEYTRNTASDSYSVAVNDTTGTTVTCTNSTISLSASDRSGSGYVFDGWYRGTDLGENNATTLVSSNRSCTDTNYSGTSYYYAKYTLDSFNITYNADASPATATAGTIKNPTTNSVPTGVKKVYGVDYTITSNKFTRAGYTQVGWSTTPNSTSSSGSGFYAFGATYSTNAALILYPVWELNTPTKLNDANSPPQITTPLNMTVGGSVDLTPSVSAKSADANRAYTSTIVSTTAPAGYTASIGTNPSNASTFLKFTASTPGVYVVRLTVTDTSVTNVVNTNNRASANTNDVTINVVPDTPTFTLELHDPIADPLRDGSESDKALKIMIGTRYYFVASVDQTYLTNHPAGSSAGQYTYTWSTDPDFAQAHIVGTGTAIAFNENYDLITVPADPDQRDYAAESTSIRIVTLYCRATCNSAYNSSLGKALYYYVQPLIKSFKYEPLQKIYNTNDQTVSLAAQYNMNNNTTFTDRLLFSADNNTFVEADSQQGFITSFVNAIRSYLYPSGPKFFKMEITGRNSQNELITSVSDTIHTTVGTAESSASRTLYFNNTTSAELKNYLVMCYYVDGSGELGYQTAQDMHYGTNNAGQNYRVLIPADAESVCFGVVATNVVHKYYGMPTVSNGVISGFTEPIYQGYTNQVSIDDSVGKITTDSMTVNGALWLFQCSGSAH